MAIFEVKEDTITPVERTTFGVAGLKERDDIQRHLRDQIGIVAPDVLVIAEEFGEWVDSRRRIDLLGIDREARLVVIELKRTEEGGHMELQALRYAAMVSTLTASRAVEVFGKYLAARSRDDDPEQTLLDFLGWPSLDEEEFGQDVRIVLVSADFSRELTTAVMWLNDKDLDIRCVRIRPYDNHGQTLIDVQQVIPLPEAGDYQVQVREKKRRERTSRESKMDFTRFDVEVGGVVHQAQWKRNAILIVLKALWQGGSSPQEIAEAMSLGSKRLWLEVEGEISDVDEFHERAMRAAYDSGVSYDQRRWHTKPEDLLVRDGRTYVFTNQWGKRWEGAMERLASAYPDQRISWHAASSSDG